MFTLGGRTALRSARAAGSGHTALHSSSQSTRGGATVVGYNLHGIVTGRVPIEPKWCDFTLQTYSGICWRPTGAVATGVYTNKRRTHR
jgi:hypothetical protein